MRTTTAALAALLVGVVLLVPILGATAPSQAPASAAAGAETPTALLPVYQKAAGTYCDGLPWQVLAAIGAIESGHGAGRIDPATGDVLPAIYGPVLDGTNGNARLVDPS